MQPIYDYICNQGKLTEAHRTELKPDIQAFLALYAKFQTGAAWLAKRQAQGIDNAPHLAKFRQLEAQIDTEWDNMPIPQKDELLALLAQNGAIPRKVITVKELFGGQVEKIT